MTKKNYLDRLAVCSWSLQPAGSKELVSWINELKIPRVQLALDPLRRDPAVWNDLFSICSKNGIAIVSGMFGTMGEDYSTMESIRMTGGIVPDETWQDNWDNIQRTAEIASGLKLKLVSFHAGFLPENESDPAFENLLHRLRLVADVFAAKGIDLALETGQESAPVLKSFLNHLGRKNVGVNFDPANMILYDKGDPIEALQVLGPFLKQCHIKDALKTKVPGTWGEEVTTGTGEVDWPRFFHTLDQLGFNGYCAVEREAGSSRLQDIRQAKDFISKLAG